MIASSTNHCRESFSLFYVVRRHLFVSLVSFVLVSAFTLILLYEGRHTDKAHIRLECVRQKVRKNKAKLCTTNNLLIFISALCGVVAKVCDSFKRKNQKKKKPNASCSYKQFFHVNFWFTMFYWILKFNFGDRLCCRHHIIYLPFLCLLFLSNVLIGYQYTWTVSKLNGPLTQ